jgi:hypothetical protein
MVAIWVGGIVTWAGLVVRHNPPEIHAWDGILNLLMSGPLWLPLAFAAYAMGRRQLTIRFAVVVFIAELIAIGVTYLFVRNMLRF